MVDLTKDPQSLLLGPPDATGPAGKSSYVAGAFSTEHEFLKAIHSARTNGWSTIQTWTPYAVHGLDPALGLTRSWIGRPVFTVILIGFALCLFMQFHLMVEDWPITYSGRPYFTWPLWVVPTLETGLLFGALVNMALAAQTSRLVPDPFLTLPDSRSTDDHFVMAISIQDASADRLRAFFTQFGAAPLADISPEKASGDPEFANLGSPAAADSATKDSIHA